MNFPIVQKGDILYTTEINAPILVVHDGFELYFVTLLGDIFIPDFDQVYLVQRPIPDDEGLFWPSRCAIIFDERRNIEWEP